MAFARDAGDAPPGRRALGPLLDRAGVVASSLCALHCAATPALLAAAPALGVAFGDERWEWPFLLASCALGAAALVPGFLRSGRAIALGVFVAGALGAIAGKLAFAGGSVAEGALSALGALGIACAHVINLRVVRRAHRGGVGAGAPDHRGGPCVHPPAAAPSR
ncbi:MAG TPA: MerC domain-containing protein [Polyangiaceae bacterium]|nr:MerC domain-containing protein [Polyangiaceae bacterium]